MVPLQGQHPLTGFLSWVHLLVPEDSITAFQIHCSCQSDRYITWLVLCDNSGASATDRPPQALTASSLPGSVPSRQLKRSSCQMPEYRHLPTPSLLSLLLPLFQATPRLPVLQTGRRPCPVKARDARLPSSSPKSPWRFFLTGEQYPPTMSVTHYFSESPPEC